MTVELLQWTPHPINTVYQLFFHQKHGTPLEPFGPATDEQWAFVRQLLLENWCGLLEFPVFIWNMVLPRAMHAQVRVHRHWSYWSESHQLYEPNEFANEKDYFEIPDLTPEQRHLETCAMRQSQLYYKLLREDGVLPALARGVLPLHINLGLSCAINLRSLVQTAILRRCHILQGTYWNPLLDRMADELATKVDPRLKELFFLQPCDVNGQCISPVEQELRVEGKDPHVPCPRYMVIREQPKSDACCGHGGCLGCLKGAVNNGRAVERRNDQ